MVESAEAIDVPYAAAEGNFKSPGILFSKVRAKYITIVKVG
jgi:hypothetical protein